MRSCPESEWQTLPQWGGSPFPHGAGGPSAGLSVWVTSTPTQEWSPPVPASQRSHGRAWPPLTGAPPFPPGPCGRHNKVSSCLQAPPFT